MIIDTTKDIQQTDIIIKRGDDNIFELSLFDENDDVYNIEHVKYIDMQIKHNGKTIVKLSSEDNSGINISDPANGIIVVEIAHSLTENLRGLQCVYDLQLTSGEDKVLTILEGNFTIENDVTKRV